MQHLFLSERNVATTAKWCTEEVKTMKKDQDKESITSVQWSKQKAVRRAGCCSEASADCD